MPVDFSLAPKISGSDYLGPLQAMELGRQAQRSAIQDQRDQQKQAARDQALQQYSSGDSMGARQTATAAGDFDFADYLGKAEEDHRKQIASVYDTAARAAFSLRQLPPEQRQAAFDAAAPRLQAMGIPGEILAEYRGKLDDAGLDSVARESMSILEQINTRKPVVLADGSELRDPQSGALIAGNQRDSKFIPVQGVDEQGRPITSFVEVGPNGAPVAGSVGAASAGAPGASPGVGSSAPRSVRNSNPGNIEDGTFARSQPGYAGSDGRFAKFATPQAGAAAQGALLGSYIDRGFNTVEKIINRWAPLSDNNDTSSYVATVARALNVNPKDTLSKSSIPALQAAIARVEGGPGASSGVPAQGGGNTITVLRGPVPKKDAPSGYEYGPDGRTLRPIPGGPADAGAAGGKQVRQTETQFRKEFDALPEVKTFKTARQQYFTLRSLAEKKNPTGADDIALIFNFMKTLDPGSVVREGEFASAANSGGIPQNIQNQYNRVLNGTRLSAQQRREFVASATRPYVAARDAYNQAAENYRSYARDSGANPDRVARTYTPTSGVGARKPATPASTGWGKAQVVR